MSRRNGSARGLKHASKNRGAHEQSTNDASGSNSISASAARPVQSSGKLLLEATPPAVTQRAGALPWNGKQPASLSLVLGVTLGIVALISVLAWHCCRRKGGGRYERVGAMEETSSVLEDTCSHELASGTDDVASIYPIASVSDIESSAKVLDDEPSHAPALAEPPILTRLELRRGSGVENDSHCWSNLSPSSFDVRGPRHVLRFLGG